MDLQNSHIVIDGTFVSVKHERIARSIMEYDEDLRVYYIPQGQREPGQAAFKITYEPPGQSPYTLFHVPTEEEFDERQLMRIIANDQRVNGGVTMSDLEAFEVTQKRLQQQDYLDSIAEAHDIAAHVIASPLNTYKVSKDLVFKDGMPFNAATKK